jgi:hypothetical protein
VKSTVVGLVTPHILRVIDLANMAEAGTNVDWHLSDAVATTLEELRHQYNAADLLSAYVDGLETAARDAPRSRLFYAGALKSAAAQAARRQKVRD